MRYRVRRDTPEAKTTPPTESARFRSGMRAARRAGELAARDRAVYVVEAVNDQATIGIVHTAWPDAAGGDADAGAGVREPRSPKPRPGAAQAAVRPPDGR